MIYEELIKERNRVFRSMQRAIKAGNDLFAMGLSFKLIDLEDAILKLVPEDLLEDLYV